MAFYEVCHLLTRACRTRLPLDPGQRITRDAAIASVREFFRLPLQPHDVTEEEGARALEMACGYSKLHADMTFLWWAMQLDCQWCTADEKVLAATRPGFPVSRILVLSSMRE